MATRPGRDARIGMIRCDPRPSGPSQGDDDLKIEIEAVAKVPAETAWDAWNDPEQIKQWNTPSADWHTTSSTVDLREGGRMSSRMEAKDGSMGFDFSATFTKLEPPKFLAFRLDDDREVTVAFEETPDGTRIRETFDAESQHDPEFQRQGWQAILDSFVRHVETKTKTA